MLLFKGLLPKLIYKTVSLFVYSDIQAVVLIQMYQWSILHPHRLCNFLNQLV